MCPLQQVVIVQPLKSWLNTHKIRNFDQKEHNNALKVTRPSKITLFWQKRLLQYPVLIYPPPKLQLSWPYLCRGVLWLRSFVFVFAPRLMSNSKISLFLPLDTTCRGVCWFLFWMFTSAPCCRRTWQMDTWPFWTAMWSAEFWFASWWLTNFVNSRWSLVGRIALTG